MRDGTFEFDNFDAIYDLERHELVPVDDDRLEELVAPILEPEEEDQ